MRTIASAMLGIASMTLLGLASPARADAVLQGDLQNGASLFRVQCGTCHGVDGRGGGDLADKLSAPVGNLRDSAFLAAHSDDDLEAAILKGVPSGKPPMPMPASPWLTGLQLEDIIAFLRKDALKVSDFFPTAQYFIAKSYPLDAKAQERVKKQAGQSLSAAEASISVVTIYGEGNDKGPVFVPQDPVQLDKLSPKDRKGYVVFVDLPQGKGHTTMGIAMGRDGRVIAVRSEAGLTDPAQDKDYQAYVGQGDKGVPEPLKAAKAKGKGKTAGPTAAEDRAFNLEYARASAGIALADAEEKDRHWADTN
jgi:mono/diheme cytochrome c family protein